MAEQFVIGIDMGTSAIKGVLVSEDGTIAAAASRPTEITRPGPGQVEFSATGYYKTLSELVRTLAQKPGGKVSAIALSGATGDTVLLDALNNPILPGIHWMDSRSAEDARIDPPGMSAADIYEVSGWPWFRGFPLAQLAWTKREKGPEYRQTAKIGMNMTYQLFRLCGAWAMDYSTATTFYLQDQKNRSWYPPYLKWLEVKEQQLPKLLPSGTRIGTVTEQAALETGLPAGCAVVLGAFDHPSAARGAGATRPGDLLLSLGTSWVGFYPVMGRETAIEQNMLVDPFLSDTGGPWGAIFSLSKAGERLNAALASVYAGRSESERYALFEKELHTCRETGKPANAAIALVNELASTMFEKTERFAQKGFEINRLFLVGGPSTNKAIVDLFKAIFHKPVQTALSASHAGALGAAKLALEKQSPLSL